MKQTFEQMTRFAAMVLKSEQSMPARAMEELDLNRVVFFVVKSATEAQREQLCHHLGAFLIKRIPLKKAKREMVICRTADNVNDAKILAAYETILKPIFGPKPLMRARIIRRIALCYSHSLRLP